LVVGQPPPLLNGQQTETHAEVPDTVTDAVLSVPVTVPGVPEPVSPVTPNQSPSLKPESGVASSVTAPSATQTVCVMLLAAPFATVTLHQPETSITVSATGVAPLQPVPLSPEPDPLLPLLLLLVLPLTEPVVLSELAAVDPLLDSEDVLV
jgi:hypothetical protein